MFLKVTFYHLKTLGVGWSQGLALYLGLGPPTQVPFWGLQRQSSLKMRWQEMCHSPRRSEIEAPILQHVEHMASLDMCLLRMEQVANRSRISWKHTSTRQNMLKLTQSALPVLDSNETRHVISEVYNVVGEELEFAMQVTQIG